MSMKVSRIHTYWSVEEACMMLELLDQVRDQLWESYGEQIIAYRLDEEVAENGNEQQQVMQFIEDDPF